MREKVKILSLIAAVFFAFGCTRLTLPEKQMSPESPADESGAVTSGRVLRLKGQNLTKLPQYVLTMTDLEELDISDNQITGALQAEIRQLKNLKILRASRNLMTGVPAEIGQLSFLEILDLSDNALTGLPYELGNLTKLRELDLRGNDVAKQDLAIIQEKLTQTKILVDT